jgi:hypothetical protein
MKGICNAQAKKSPLTFIDLRLANMVHPDVAQDDPMLENLDELVSQEPDLARALAAVVTAADMLAQQAGIDLAAAIRARFEPPEGPVYSR